LRGYVNKHGKMMPNYHYEDLELLHDMYTKRGLENIALVVDANHSNSAKNPFEQSRICKEVLHSCRHNGDVKKMIKGFMIESYLEDGSQSVDGTVFGKSITDPCLGWEKSEKLILEIADLI
ncbi:MAG: 3-deoxy-7-phosphoheptulonate synthase, partial [Eubacteriales bacterium]|nr:3-deoxy-7-phosphoheptulonate synthase [Eubacteriales bacterium]